MSKPPPPKTIAAGRYLRLMARGQWEYAERVGATGVVAVLAVTDSNEIVLTEQFRPAVDTRVIDLPAGLAGDNTGAEAFETAARRELEEETGFQADVMTHRATLPTSPGLTSETVQLFVADGVRRIAAGGGDDSEDIQVHVVPLADLAEWLPAQLRQGLLIDPKVYAAQWWCARDSADP